jgi:hypothetical protein
MGRSHKSVRGPGLVNSQVQDKAAGWNGRYLSLSRAKLAPLELLPWVHCWMSDREFSAADRNKLYAHVHNRGRQ